MNSVEKRWLQSIRDIKSFDNQNNLFGFNTERSTFEFGKKKQVDIQKREISKAKQKIEKEKKNLDKEYLFRLKDLPFPEDNFFKLTAKSNSPEKNNSGNLKKTPYSNDSGDTDNSIITFKRKKNSKIKSFPYEKIDLYQSEKLIDNSLKNTNQESNNYLKIRKFSNKQEVKEKSQKMLNDLHPKKVNKLSKRKYSNDSQVTEKDDNTKFLLSNQIRIKPSERTHFHKIKKIKHSIISKVSKNREKPQKYEKIKNIKPSIKIKPIRRTTGSPNYPAQQHSSSNRLYNMPELTWKTQQIKNVKKNMLNKQPSFNSPKFYERRTFSQHPHVFVGKNNEDHYRNTNNSFGYLLIPKFLLSGKFEEPTGLNNEKVTKDIDIDIYKKGKKVNESKLRKYKSSKFHPSKN